MATFKVSSNIKEVRKYLKKTSKKTFPKVIKDSLDKTMFNVKDELEKGLEKSLDNPTKFTKKFLGYYKAKTSRLRAGVFIKDHQAKYLKYQIYGGKREPENNSIITPTTNTKLNKHGNISRAKRNTLFNKANNQSSGRTKHFIGKPKNSNLPYGLYKSIRSKKKSKLSMQLGFYKTLKYQKRFHFYKIAKKTAQRNIEKNFVKFMKKEGLF